MKKNYKRIFSPLEFAAFDGILLKNQVFYLIKVTWSDDLPAYIMRLRMPISELSWSCT